MSNTIEWNASFLHTAFHRCWNERSQVASRKFSAFYHTHCIVAISTVMSFALPPPHTSPSRLSDIATHLKRSFRHSVGAAMQSNNNQQGKNQPDPQLQGSILLMGHADAAPPMDSFVETATITASPISKWNRKSRQVSATITHDANLQYQLTI